MKELRGKQVAERLKNECLDFVGKRNGEMPALAILRVGEREADLSYQRSVKKRFMDFGLEVKDYVLPETVSDAEFRQTFDFLNEDPEIQGILVMRPLPAQLDEGYVIRRLKPEKDLDGLTNENLAGLFRGEESAFAPCTAQAVVELLKEYEIPLSGKHVVILGRSLVVGRPLSQLLLRENATVTVCHSKSENLKEITRQADILVVAIGKAREIGSSYIRDGAVVVDVGIHSDAEGRLCGDCDYDTITTKAEAVTPVPGGLGIVTTAVLGKHLVLAAERQRKPEGKGNQDEG